MDLKDLNATLNAIDAACDHGKLCAANGESVVYAQYANRVVSTLFESLGLSLLLVGAVLVWLAVAFGVRRALPAMILSVFFSPLVVLGLLALFQFSVNFGTGVAASVLVGLTGDNAVQYLFASRGRRLKSGIDSRSGATVQITLLNIGASLLFLGLTPTPLKHLGILLAFGFASSLVGDLWLLRGLIGGGEAGLTGERGEAASQASYRPTTDR
jgi:predicted RND superfamily exporter protein